MGRTIHIVGGGIGGLTAAVALQARGFDIQVHEAAPSYAHVGGGHWLYANALNALARVDPTIPSDMAARGTTFDGFCFTTRTGRTLLFESAAPYTPRPERAPIVIHRADIIDVLAKRLPADRLHFGRRLSRYADRTLEFEDGTRIDADLVIGADGIHSVMRRDTLSPTPPRFSGQIGMWGISSHALPEDTGKWFTEMWGDGIRMGFTYVGRDGVYWFMVVRGETVPTDPEERKAFILERASTYPEAMTEVVRTTDAEGIHTNPLFDVSPLSVWHTDEVLCIGDAVHACTPNLGQGGCQAIEDGVRLAELLDAMEPPLAFAALQRERYRKATAVVYLSRWLGEFAQLPGIAGRIRNFLVWITPAFVVRPVLKWIMT